MRPEILRNIFASSSKGKRSFGALNGPIETAGAMATFAELLAAGFFSPWCLPSDLASSKNCWSVAIRSAALAAIGREIVVSSVGKLLKYIAATWAAWSVAIHF